MNPNPAFLKQLAVVFAAGAGIAAYVLRAQPEYAAFAAGLLAIIVEVEPSLVSAVSI